MSTVFLLIAAFTLLSAMATVSLRNLVHCALFAALTFAGIAAMFLNLGAQFIGFAQVLVYVGAVAILVVFAILLTHGRGSAIETTLAPASWIGLAVALLVGLTLAGAVLGTSLRHRAPPTETTLEKAGEIRRIGEQLMTEFVVPLEIVALLLTAATIGAVIIAMQEKGRR